MGEVGAGLWRPGASDGACVVSSLGWFPPPAADGGRRPRAPDRPAEPGSPRCRCRRLGAALRKGRLAAASAAQPVVPRPVLCRRPGVRRAAPVRRMKRHLVIFARAPQLGRVKRRLAAEIGLMAATRFYRAVLAAEIRRLANDRRSTAWLFVAPHRPLTHPAWCGPRPRCRPRPPAA